MSLIRSYKHINPRLVSFAPHSYRWQRFFPQLLGKNPLKCFGCMGDHLNSIQKLLAKILQQFEVTKKNPMIYSGSSSHLKVMQDFVCINRITTLLEDKGLLQTLGSVDRHQTLQGSQPSSSYPNTWRTVERTIRANHENSPTCINWACSGKVLHATHGVEHNLKHLRFTKPSGSNMSQN